MLQDRRKAGFLAFLISLAIMGCLWIRYADLGNKAVEHTRKAVNTAQVKYDLVTLANAEHGRFASEGRYASLEELLERGDIARTGRPPYLYQAELGQDGFRIVATLQGPSDAATPRLISIDEKYEFKEE